MGLFSNKQKGRTDAVDIFRMRELVRSIISQHLKENPNTTLARVLNDLHYEIGRGKHDIQAERELLNTMSGSERDEWYQSIASEFDIDRGLLMDSARTDAGITVEKNGNFYLVSPKNSRGETLIRNILETSTSSSELLQPKYSDILNIAPVATNVNSKIPNLNTLGIGNIDSARSDMTDGEIQTLQRNFTEIVNFYEQNGRVPEKNKANPAEYILGARLEALRSQPDKTIALQGFDNHNLLTRSDNLQGKNMKNTLKQDGKQFVLKTDAYEKRFDSEPQAMIFAKRHNIDLSARKDSSVEDGEYEAKTNGNSIEITKTRNDYFESKESLISELEGALEYLKRLKIEVVSKPSLGGELKWQEKYVEDLKREIANWDSVDFRGDSARKDAGVLSTRIKISKAMGHFDAEDRKDEKYNGWKNYATWNVSLWINNDYGLYSMAQEYKKEGGNKYLGFVEYAGLSGTTPDGESWTGADLDYQALDAMIREI